MSGTLPQHTIGRLAHGVSPRQRPGHLLAILPRGESIRNFVYTGVLDRVAEDVPVSVLSVSPNDALWSLLEGRYGAVFPLDEIPERWLVGALRELLDAAHGRRLWSEAARERWRLRDAKHTVPQFN